MKARNTRSQTAMGSTMGERRMRSKNNGLELESPIKSPFQQPRFNHFKHLTVRENAGIKSPEPFSFEPFKIPKHGFQKRVCSFAPGKSKNICFTDIVKSEKAWVPGPIYILHSDWRKHLPPRGKFLKAKKELFTDTVFKREKNKVPPTAYNVLNAKENRPLGALKLTDSHINFTEEAKWQGLQTPHVNYTKNFT